MKMVGKVLYAIVSAVLLILTVFNIYALYSVNSGADTAPSLFGYSYAVVLSNSMAPDIGVGDWLIFREEQEYQVGNIVEFESKGSSVTHRIVEKTADGFITKGDANNVEDTETVQAEQIHGKMVLNLRGAGHIVLFLRTPSGLLFLVAAGVFVLTLPTVCKMGKEYVGKRKMKTGDEPDKNKAE